MTMLLSSEAYERLEKKFGKDETKELFNAVQAVVDKKFQEHLEGVRDKADFLITQKKFELKDELTKELATKADIALLKGDITRLEGLMKEDSKRLEGLMREDSKRLEGLMREDSKRLEGLMREDSKRLEGLWKGDSARLEGLINEHAARLAGDIKTLKVELDRKFTIMFLILLFSIFFVNQNAIKFLAELFGLIKP
jgi:hypothetical protein